MWRVLSDPQRCSHAWTNEFCRRLFSIAGHLRMAGRVGGAMWPIFISPCRHLALDQFYVATGNNFINLNSGDDDDEDTEDDYLFTPGALIARTPDWAEPGGYHVFWMPVCCERTNAWFKWHYVARALCQRMNRAIVAQDAALLKLSHEPGHRHLFIQ